MKSFLLCSKNKILRFFTSNYFPFIFYTVLMLIFHFIIEMNYGDDDWFEQILGDDSGSFKVWAEYLVSRYYQWSSRIVIESILILIVNAQFLWKIIDTAVMLWIAVALSLFFNRKGRTSVNWFIVFAMLSFPMDALRTAGWIATTLNYSWTLAFGLLAMLPIKNIVCGQKNRWYIYLLALPALIYSVNHEQMCAVMLAICGLFTVYIFVRDKKVPWFVLFETLISLASLIFILTCPGNNNRTIQEIATFFPTFADVSFLRKVEMGYLSAMYEFIMQPNLVFALFCAVIVAAVFIYNKKAIYRLIAVIPFVISLVMIIFSNLLTPLLPNAQDLIDQMSETGFGTDTLLLDLFVTAVGICILISLWAVFRDKLKSSFLIYLVLLGLATRWVIGFSPTIWASGNRTCTFMYFALITVSVILFKIIAETDSNNKFIKGFMSSYIVIHIIFLAEKYLFYLRSF